MESAFTACGESTQAPDSRQGVTGLLAHRSSAAALGAVFLAAHPDEADFDSLVTRLGLRPDSLPAKGSPELVSAAKTIHALHINDFRKARLIEIEGWMLSLTELRLAALTHLTMRA